MLSALVQEQHGHEFVFVTGYPTGIRRFYHMRSDSDPQKTLSFDLLWKGLEVTTGAQREHRHDRLHAKPRPRACAPNRCAAT
ncbi:MULTISPECIES: amino acid--tRNA ligase-related protein [Actinomadura]|uniref:Amino acid--tRNA ligase-related protein n=1 Tax=Actinomadura yumaensis TaxID=111807 RepID=A0ABW2CJN2_9ACTN|nr:amino acid--tRNA ligase-related protein [Actinomadura sp. J1-007]